MSAIFAANRSTTLAQIFSLRVCDFDL